MGWGGGGGGGRVVGDVERGHSGGVGEGHNGDGGHGWVVDRGSGYDRVRSCSSFAEKSRLKINRLY